MIVCLKDWGIYVDKDKDVSDDEDRTEILM